MKKFNFRLQRVLDYRASLKKEKERELAKRNAELFAEQKRLENIISMQDSAEFPKRETMTMAELIQVGDYFRYLQQALVNQRLIVEEAVKAVDLAREAYIEKAVETESLETLKEKRRTEFVLEQRKEENKDLDELTVQRYRQRKDELAKR